MTATLNNIDKLFEDAGYYYKHGEGTSGRPRFRKNQPDGIIFFFPNWKWLSNSPDSKYIHVLLRKVKVKYLEDIYENTFTMDEVTKEFIQEIERIYNIL